MEDVLYEDFKLLRDKMHREFTMDAPESPVAAVYMNNCMMKLKECQFWFIEAMNAKIENQDAHCPVHQ